MGRRRIFVPKFTELSKEEAAAYLTKWRSDELGTDELDPEIIDRMVWEYQNVTDGKSLAVVMDELAARYPAREGSDAVPAALPVLPDLGQTLNMASADSRGVIVIVHPDNGADEDLEQRLSGLLFEEGIAGRSHAARLTASEWARAKEIAQVRGGELETGVFFVVPDAFGLDGDITAEFDGAMETAELRTGLVAALDEFRSTWTKNDRKAHLKAGAEGGFTWTEYDPDVDGLVTIGAGSKKLGAEPEKH